VTLTFLPFLLSAIRGSIRLLAVGSTPFCSIQITGQAWIMLLLTVSFPFLYLEIL